MLILVFQSGSERIAPIAKSDSLVGDFTRRVLPQYRVKSRDHAAELEGMPERYCPVEFLPASARFLAAHPTICDFCLGTPHPEPTPVRLNIGTAKLPGWAIGCGLVLRRISGRVQG